VVASIDAAVTIALSFAAIWYWGIVGGAIATVAAAACAAIASFAIGFTKFGLTLPLTHLVRIALATVAMGALLQTLPEAGNFIALATHIAGGACVYVITLAILYAPSIFRLLSARPQQTG
jgi:O-antigen/teichoic acid export membrane protein